MEQVCRGFPNTRRGAVLALFLAGVLGGCDSPSPPPPPPAPTAQQSAGPAKAAAKAQPAVDEKAAAKVREDAELASRVKSALLGDEQLKKLGIDIKADGGKVGLYGTAGTKALGEKAVKTAAAVAGVSAVENHLVILAGS